MPATKHYVVLQSADPYCSIRVDEETGDERRFKPGDAYDGPDKHVPTLLKGVDFHGPLIAEKNSDAAAPPATPRKEK